MIGEIIAIGDELVSGRIINSTSAYAAREIFLLGHKIRAIHTIGDEPEQIGNILTIVLARCDFVIVTGGLGPTTDDLTNEAVIKALALKSEVHPGVLANIASYLGGSNAALFAKLAQLPQGAEVLDNNCRIAGYRLLHQGKPIYFLPGVPPQMEFLLRDRVLPDLKALFSGQAAPCQQIFRTCGLKEVEINEKLLPLEADSSLQIGYYPVGCEVHISLTMPNGRTANGDISATFQHAEDFIRQAMGPALYATGSTTLAAATGEMVCASGAMLGVAESCTGGLLATMITETPGSSRWFCGGVVVYANTVKERLLGVDPDILARYGAVSEETARAMAIGAAECLRCELSLAITGIAGPDGGTEEKPVGTVWIAMARQGRVSARPYHFYGHRRQIQERSAQSALDMLRRDFLSLPGKL